MAVESLLNSASPYAHCAVQAKYDFIDKMLEWSGAREPKRVLDVGCGFGGTSRRLAAAYPNAQVEGITLSPEQVKRGTELAQERCLSAAQCRRTVSRAAQVAALGSN